MNNVVPIHKNTMTPFMGRIPSVVIHDPGYWKPIPVIDIRAQTLIPGIWRRCLSLNIWKRTRNVLQQIIDVNYFIKHLVACTIENYSVHHYTLNGHFDYVLTKCMGASNYFYLVIHACCQIDRCVLDRCTIIQFQPRNQWGHTGPKLIMPCIRYTLQKSQRLFVPFRLVASRMGTFDNAGHVPQKHHWHPRDFGHSKTKVLDAATTRCNITLPYRKRESCKYGHTHRMIVSGHKGCDGRRLVDP